MTRMLWLLTCSTLLLSLGCQAFSDSDFFAADDKPCYKKPMELVSFWQDGVDVHLDPSQGGIAAPGFSGRVIFHHINGTKGETVAVDGTILVQLFEDKPYQGPVQPLETWTILPQHLPLLMKRDLSGWGYALWLPWTSCNPNIRSGQLIVKYTGKDGVVLNSEPIQIHMGDNRQGGLSRPQLDVKKVSKNTWQ